MKIGIIGLGHVGQAMYDLFTNAVIYDEPKQIGTREEANESDVAFVCVPTPQMENGKCDTSIVEDVVSWLEAKVIVLRSTVPVGFTDYLMSKYNKRIVFQPEYYGETVNHPFATLKNREWISLGGNQEDIDIVISAYQTVMTSNVAIHQVDAKTAEMAKYMENAYLATKVTFCNEMYDLCKKLGVNYNQVREVWTADPRIGTSHTFVYENNRGFGGSCLPKDLSSIIYQAEQNDADVTLLKSVKAKNNLIRKNK